MIRTILLTLLAAVITVVVGLTLWIFSAVGATSQNESVVNFTVAKGEGIRSIAGRLEKDQLISARLPWTLYTVLTGRHTSLIPGTYTFQTAVTGKAVVEQLVAGPTEEREVTVTIPEGERLEEIATILENKGVVDAAAFLSLTKQPSDFVQTWTTDLFASKPPTVDLEGYLFPDTYRFFENTPAETVVRRMIENTDRRLDATIRAKILTSGRSLHEILTLASILEMELKTPSDRAIAADLFLRRMAAGIALQSDATVNYVTGKSRLQPTIADTEVESPYNTYRNKGLPPGPIANPGLGAINAAITPTPNEFFFYLTAPGGQTIWSKTYEEHLTNKRRYLDS